MDSSGSRGLLKAVGASGSPGKQWERVRERVGASGSEWERNEREREREKETDLRKILGGGSSGVQKVFIGPHDAVNTINCRARSSQ